MKMIEITWMNGITHIGPPGKQMGVHFPKLNSSSIPLNDVTGKTVEQIADVLRPAVNGDLAELKESQLIQR